MQNKQLVLPKKYYGFHYLTLFLKTNYIDYLNKSKLYYESSSKEDKYINISDFALYFLNLAIGDMQNNAINVVLAGKEYMTYILNFLDKYKRYKNSKEIRMELVQDYYNKIANETLNIVSTDVFNRVKRVYR